MSGTESPSHAPITPETIHIQPIDDIHISDLEDEEEKHISPTRIRQRYILGVILLLCVVCLWVASSTIIQAIFVDLHFGSPFFLTYYSTSLFTIYIGVYYIQQWFKKWRTSHRTLERLSVSSSPTTREMARLTPSSQRLDDVDYTMQQHVEESQQYIISDTAHLALFLCPIWFLMNYLFNLSLNMTSVASNTILSTLSGFFVMTFSWILFGTRPALMNMVGVALTITGAVCISLKPENDPSGSGQSDTIAGDLVASTSAIFYGLYTVMLRYKIPDESKVNMLLMFGFIGLFNLLLFWPAFFVLNTMEWERFQWPQGQVIMFLTLNGLFGTVVSDFLWAKSVLLTSPLIATLGLSLTIPIAMITDFLLHHTSFSALYLLGSVLVLAGFILVNYHFKRDIDTNIRRTSLEGQHSSFDEREHSSSVSSNTESRIPLDPTEHR